MEFTELLLSSYSNEFPFSKEAGLRFIKESLEKVIFCREELDRRIINILGPKNINESDKRYALRKLNNL